MPKSEKGRAMTMNAFKEALYNSLGNVTIACKNVGISRRTYYNWRNEYPEFREECDEVDEVNLDFAESQLLKNIKAGATTELIFYLKTKGKHRGYSERIETKDVTDISQLLKTKERDQIIEDLANEAQRIAKIAKSSHRNDIE